MTICNKSIQGRDPFAAGCVLSVGHVGVCVTSSGDRSGLPKEAAPLTEESVNAAMLLLERRVRGEVSRVTARVGLLEAAWTVGGETLSERLNRVVLGTMEQIRAVAHRVDNLEQTSAGGAATDDMFVVVNRRLARLEGPAKDDAVNLSTDEYAGLLKDREELHALRNAAQCAPGTDLRGLLRDRARAVYPGDVEAWRKAADKLGALEAAGVDNWEGYSHAMSIYRGEEND